MTKDVQKIESAIYVATNGKPKKFVEYLLTHHHMILFNFEDFLGNRSAANDLWNLFLNNKCLTEGPSSKVKTLPFMNLLETLNKSFATTTGAHFGVPLNGGCHSTVKP